MQLRNSRKYLLMFTGDCVIHDALVVHGSKSNISYKNRRAFNFSIASRDKLTKKLKLYKNKLKNF